MIKMKLRYFYYDPELTEDDDYNDDDADCFCDQEEVEYEFSTGIVYG